MDNGELTVDNVLPLIAVGLCAFDNRSQEVQEFYWLLVPKLCLGILRTEAPASRNEAELQKKQFPSRSLGTRKRNKINVFDSAQC
ncbi:MAG: hypothetical protein D3910_09250 [Candidatus Electrothrix sp. ATG2]|nr:hypothetical protein [Candidatus Electrothrix sp. ATG2]